MRIKVFAAIILSFFIILIAGIFFTQTLKYNLYRELSEKNRIRVVPLAAPRGKIYDRNGKLLVSNRISFDAEVIFDELTDKEKVINQLSDILGTDKKVLSEKIEKARRMPFIPVKIKGDIGKKKAIQIEEARMGLPGVIVTTKPLRSYIYKNTLSHITGYLGKISESELQRYKTYGYRMQDFVGKDGIERKYNDYLRGVDGGLQTEVDNKGRQLSLLAIKEPRPGRDLHLSVDIELQKFCDSILSDKKGAIIAMVPSTGEILALVSHPDFDPNIFISPSSIKEVSNLLNDSRTFPMLDRAISGTYPPGSVFKVVIMDAALESGKFNKEDTFFCKGSFPVGNRLFRCWKNKGHGTQNIIVGVKNSCNVFFYQLGLLVGADVLAKYAFRLGLGRPTGIDLPGEASGLVPSPSWKRRELRARWFKGETANYAIGQGYLLVTPIQVLRLISTIANGGRLVQPFVVERIGDIRLDHPIEDIGMKEEALEIIKEGLRDVVNDPHATGIYAKSEDVIIAGKTGTAQNPGGKPHAWFTGFAPFENPGISVVVFIEHGGKGGLEPARFARKIIEEAKRLKLL